MRDLDGGEFGAARPDGGDAEAAAAFDGQEGDHVGGPAGQRVPLAPGALGSPRMFRGGPPVSIFLPGFSQPISVSVKAAAGLSSPRRHATPTRHWNPCCFTDLHAIAPRHRV
jgi:hypothetical protein